MTFTPHSRDDSTTTGPVAHIPGPPIGPARRPAGRSSWWAPLLETAIIAAVAIAVSMTLRHAWMRSGEGTWESVQHVLNDKDQFIAAGSDVVKVIPILIALRMIVGIVLRCWTTTRRGELQSVHYDDLDRIKAVAQYHAALATVFSALGVETRDISLRDHIHADTLHAGSTAVRWQHTDDGTHLTNGERLWAVLVATIAATISYRQATGNGGATIRVADWADSDIAELHTLAVRAVLYGERPDDVTDDWNVASVLTGAEARATDLLAAHQAQVDALTAAIVTNFLGITPRDVIAERVQRCLRTPDKVLDSRDYTSGERPAVRHARTAALGVASVASAVFLAALFTPVGTDGLAVGALEVAVLTSLLALRYRGRPLATRIADELSYHRQRRAAFVATRPIHAGDQR